MFTYWLDYEMWGKSAAAYHVTNIAIHALNTGLVFFILLKLLAWAAWPVRRVRMAAATGAALFLVHPLETESVSYIAGRSESLAALFMLAAYAVFLYRPGPEIRWLRSLAVLVLFGLAIASKENAVALAGVLVLTDLFWPEANWRLRLWRSRRLYGLMIPGALLGLFEVARALSGSRSAGFSVSGVTWYQYGLTQARALIAYVRLFLFPFGQSVDHEFPISRTLTSHGAAVALVALVLVTGLVIAFRRRFPLGAFGFLLFLILLAPTSSIIPISDPFVERRMYLPVVGLILILCELLRGLRPNRTAAIALIGFFLCGGAILCYRRNLVWSDPVRFWIDTVAASPHKVRPYTILSETSIEQGRCGEALPYLQHAAVLMPGNANLDESRGRLLECVGNRKEALRLLEDVASRSPSSHIYELIGLLYGEMGKSDESNGALQKAVQLDPWSVNAHNSLALWYLSAHQINNAVLEYQRALSIDPGDINAINGLSRAQRLMLVPARSR
ncbi:MAG: hypothetical protein U0Q18_06265 [Bryobacteraceae bacterium]